MATKSDKNDENKNKEKLIEANRIFINCIEKDFLKSFLNGENVKLKDVCINELKSLMDMQAICFPHSPVPNLKSPKLSVPKESK